MAPEDQTDDDRTDESTASESATDESSLASPGRVRERFDQWAMARPALGASLLALGSAVLAWRAVSLLLLVPTGRVTAFGVAGGVAPLVGVVLGLFALGRPEKAHHAGGAGLGLVGFTFTGLLFSGLPFAYPKLAFTGFLTGGIGAVICLTWHRGRTVRVERGPLFRLGRASLACGLVLVLAFTAAPAVSGDTFPAQMEPQGGFVVHQASLDAGTYSYQTDCDTDPGFAIGGEDCLDITVDSKNVSHVDRAARQQLDSTSVADVEINDFLIYENFYTDLRGGTDLYFELTASQAVASSQTDGNKAIDVYVSEFRSEELTARLDLIEFPGTPGIPADHIQYWTCTPHNDSGFGTVNDIRLGLDTNPRLTGGRDVSLLAHQLGSSETVLTDFEMKIGADVNDDDGVREPIPADGGPEAAQNEPGNCL